MLEMGRLLGNIIDFDQEAYRYSLMKLDKGIVLMLTQDDFDDLVNFYGKFYYKFQINKGTVLTSGPKFIQKIILDNIRQEQLNSLNILYPFDNIEFMFIGKIKNYFKIQMKLMEKGSIRIYRENDESIFCSEDQFNESIQYSSLVYYEGQSPELNASLKQFKYRLDNYQSVYEGK